VADCVTAGCDEDGTSAVEVADCVTAGGDDISAGGGGDGTSAEPVEVAEVADCVAAGGDGISASGGGDGASVAEAPDGVKAVLTVVGRAEL